MAGHIAIHNPVAPAFLFHAGRAPKQTARRNWAPAVNQNVVSGLDVLPTLCDYAGIRVPEGLPGRSNRPPIEKKNAPWRDYPVVEIDENRMVRSSRHKYMRYGGEQPLEFLFDLENDPGETRNLAQNAAARPMLERSREMLAA